LSQAKPRSEINVIGLRDFALTRWLAMMMKNYRAPMLPQMQLRAE
jgi:hypothetical protein